MSLEHDQDGTDPRARGAVPAKWAGARLANRQDSLTVVAPRFEVDEQEDDASGFNLLKYWHLVVKYRWLLAASLTLGLAAGVVATLLTTPVYRASATVQIDSEPAKVVAVESQRPTDNYDAADKFYQTQYELLKSRALAERVARNENLAYDERFLNQWKTKKSATEAKGAQAPRTAADREARTGQAAGLISGHLLVEPVRMSRIVKISYESPDPAMAAKIANAVAANYISWNLERRYEASANARSFLEDRLKQTREALEASQRRENEYAQRNELITVTSGDPKGEGAATGESLAAADLGAVNQQLATATAARIQAEQRWGQVQATPDMALPEILSNAAVQALKASRDAAWAEYQQNLRVYKPDWPAMVDARKKIESLDEQLAAQASAIRSTVKTELEVARRNEAQFRAEVERRKHELLASQGKRVEQGFINTDITTTKSLYDAMLASYKEIGIAGGIGENNISVVDKAQKPGAAVKPNPRRNLIQFGLLGLALGGLIAFVLDRFDLSLKVPEDIERDLGLPLLGTIPIAARDLSPSRALEDPKSALSEAYYSVRSALQFSTEDGAPASLLVTSSRPGEGKTTSALAIASGFARLGLRVLLVDGDMRDPSLHKILARDNGVGLSNLLAGGPTMSPSLQPTNHKNLTFLASGPPPPNPAELLAGGKMRAFLKAARAEFDMVVIDGPPVMGLADAPQLAGAAVGTVMIVEAGQTKRDSAKAALRRLRMGNAHLLGAIMTKFDLKRAGYAYGHAYGYGYGYGYGYEYGSRPLPAARQLALLRPASWFGARGRRT